MIILVGVGHVFDISNQVQQIVTEKAPVAVALELDRNRLSVLLARDRGEELPRQRGMLARFQERMANEFGVQAGDEMLAGYKAAERMNAKLFLIDMDINRVMMRINSQLTVKERLKMVGAIFATPFIRKKTVEREMERYTEEGEHYLNEIGKSMPTIKKVLLDERNEHMAKQLMNIEQKFGTVLALVGDGHVPGISRLLGERPHECIRLSQVKGWVPKVIDGTSISFTFNV
ncbi:MAG: TraB domain-containing protein [Thermoplasmata archaeon]